MAMMTDNQNSKQMNFFDQVLTEYHEGNKRLKKNFLNVMKHFYYFTEACFRKGEMSTKQKYFIALAISIIKHDEYNIVYYMKKVMEQGATEQEIMELIAICIALDGNTSLSQGVTLILETFDYFHSKNSKQHQSSNSKQDQSSNQDGKSNDQQQSDQHQSSNQNENSNHSKNKKTASE